MKKVKAIILTILFIISIPIAMYICYLDSYNYGALAMLIMYLPLAFIISNEDLRNMNLW